MAASAEKLHTKLHSGRRKHACAQAQQLAARCKPRTDVPCQPHPQSSSELCKRQGHVRSAVRILQSTSQLHAHQGNMRPTCYTRRAPLCSASEMGSLAAATQQLHALHACLPHQMHPQSSSQPCKPPREGASAPHQLHLKSSSKRRRSQPRAPQRPARGTTAASCRQMRSTL